MTSAPDDPLRRRKYANPPVAEAIVRLEWTEPFQWDVTTPGVLFERLKSTYPSPPQVQGRMQANLQPAAQRAATLELSSGPERILFSSESGTRSLGVTNGDVSAHGGAPYEGWESLESRLFAGLEAIDDVVPRPEFQTLGLRYVNHVVVPESPIQFQDFLTVSLGLPPGFPSELFGFFDRMEMRYPDGESTIALTWASVDGEPGTSSFILDLDLYYRPSAPMDLAGARAGLKELKTKEGQAFEGMLQDRLREIFVEIND